MKNAALRKKYPNDEDYEIARNTRNQIKRGLLPAHTYEDTKKGVVVNGRMKVIKKRTWYNTIDMFVEGAKSE